MAYRPITMLALVSASLPSLAAAQSNRGAAGTAAIPQTSGATETSAVQASTLESPAATSPSQGDIIVTALKRDQSVLRSAASITVLSGQALATKNITAANQLNGVVPGLTMSVAIAGVPGVTFRGLGSNAAIFSLESSVAQYQDGVYLGHNRDYVAPLYDVNHVEFIRGTQSTLLGKNTTLGAISVINNRPTHDLGYDFTIRHSFGIDGNQAQGAVNVPVSDRVQLRGAFIASHDDGWINNAYTGRSEQRASDLSGRLMVAAQPTDGLDVLLEYQHDRRRYRGQGLYAVTDLNGLLATRARAVGVPYTPGKDTSAGGSAPLVGTVQGVDPYDDQDTNRLNFIVDLQLGDFKLISQTAYTQWRSSRSTDLDFTPANLFNLTDAEASKTFTQEVRVQSPSDRTFTYVAGLYYYNNHWTYTRQQGGSPANTVGFPLTGVVDGQSILPTEAISAFGSVTLRLFERVNLDGGLRYTSERKNGSFQRTGYGTIALSLPPVALTAYEEQQNKPLDYSVGVRFQATSAVLFYGSYSRGSKSGGFQDFPVSIAGGPFAPERAYSSEVGAKARVGNGSVTAALFNTRVDGFQISYTRPLGSPPVQQSVVGNGNVRSRGFELSASYGLRSLTLSGNLVYADSIFLNNFPDNASIARAGDRLTRAPKWSGQADIGYQTDLSDRLRGYTGATLNYASRTLYQFVTAQPLAPTGDPHALLDARIGIRTSDQRWDFSVVGTNIFDRRYIDFSTAVSSAAGAFYGSFDRPRVIALQLRVKG